MKKLISGAIAALLIIPQAGFAQGVEAEFSQARDGGVQAELPPIDIGATTLDFSGPSLLGQTEGWNGILQPTKGVSMPAAGSIQTMSTAAKPEALNETAQFQAASQTQEPSPALIPNSPQTSAQAQAPTELSAQSLRKPSIATRIAHLKTFFKNPFRNDIMGERAHLDQFWTGSAAAVASIPTEGPALENFDSHPPKLETPSMTKTHSFLGLIAVPPAAAAKAVTTAARFAPYLKIGAIILSSYFISRLIKKFIGHIGNKKSWPEDKISLYKSGAAAGTWGMGAVLSMHVLGVTLNHMVAGAGIGGVLISIAAGDVINNFFEAGRVLLDHPFEAGDVITTGGQQYTVLALGWHDLKLSNADGSETIMPYIILAQAAFTVVKKNSSDKKLMLKGARLKIMEGVLDSMKEDLPKAGIKSIAKTTAVYLATVGAAFLHFSGPFSWMSPVLAPLRAGLIIAAIATTTRITRAVMRRIADRLSLSKPQALIFNGALTALVWILGGGFALKAMGTSWVAMGAGVGFISLGVGLVSQNILSGFWRWFLVRFGWAFGFNCSLKIGERISSSGITGVVSDINFYYVVITQDDGTKSYIHYSIIFPFTKLHPAQEDNANATGK